MLWLREKKLERLKKVFWFFYGITHEDTEKQADYLVQKLCNLRVFEDENGKMNLALKQIDGELLIVSQFTLYADCLSGNRPSFTRTAKPEQAKLLYEYFIQKCKEQKIKVETGIFGADMKVSLINDGPVTVMLEK